MIDLIRNRTARLAPSGGPGPRLLPSPGGPRARRLLTGVEVAWYLVVALFLTAAATALWATGDPSWLPDGPVDLAPALIGWAAGAVTALLRLHRPHRTAPLAAPVLVGTALATLLPPGPSPVLLLGTLLLLGPAPVLLAAVVRRAGPLVAAVVVAVAAAADVATSELVAGGPDGSSDGLALPVPDVVGTLVTVALPVVAGLVLRSRDTGRRTAELARVRTEERLQVARELHDLVANHVTGMTMYAQAATTVDGVPEPVSRMLAAIETSGGDALAAMRRMVGALRSDTGDLATLNVMPTTATDLAGAVRSATAGTEHVSTAIVPELDGRDPPADLVATVHRIVVEALTNIRRHAPRATAIRVGLSAPRPGTLAVEVVNDGAGGPRPAAASHGGGFGLAGLRERVTAVGGTVTAGPGEPGTWRLSAELPLDTPTSR